MKCSQTGRRIKAKVAVISKKDNTSVTQTDLERDLQNGYLLKAICPRPAGVPVRSRAEIPRSHGSNPADVLFFPYIFFYLFFLLPISFPICLFKMKGNNV